MGSLVSSKKLEVIDSNPEYWEVSYYVLDKPFKVGPSNFDNPNSDLPTESPVYVFPVWESTYVTEIPRNGSFSRRLISGMNSHNRSISNSTKIISFDESPTNIGIPLIESPPDSGIQLIESYNKNNERGKRSDSPENDNEEYDESMESVLRSSLQNEKCYPSECNDLSKERQGSSSAELHNAVGNDEFVESSDELANCSIVNSIHASNTTTNYEIPKGNRKSSWDTTWDRNERDGHFAFLQQYETSKENMDVNATASNNSRTDDGVNQRTSFDDTKDNEVVNIVDEISQLENTEQYWNSDSSIRDDKPSRNLELINVSEVISVANDVRDVSDELTASSPVLRDAELPPYEVVSNSELLEKENSSDLINEPKLIDKDEMPNLEHNAAGEVSSGILLRSNEVNTTDLNTEPLMDGKTSDDLVKYKEEAKNPEVANTQILNVEFIRPNETNMEEEKMIENKIQATETKSADTENSEVVTKKITFLPDNKQKFEPAPLNRIDVFLKLEGIDHSILRTSYDGNTIVTHEVMLPQARVGERNSPVDEFEFSFKKDERTPYPKTNINNKAENDFPDFDDRPPEYEGPIKANEPIILSSIAGSERRNQENSLTNSPNLKSSQETLRDGVVIKTQSSPTKIRSATLSLRTDNSLIRGTAANYSYNC